MNLASLCFPNKKTQKYFTGNEMQIDDVRPQYPFQEFEDSNVNHPQRCQSTKMKSQKAKVVFFESSCLHVRRIHSRRVQFVPSLEARSERCQESLKRTGEKDEVIPQHNSRCRRELMRHQHKLAIKCPLEMVDAIKIHGDWWLASRQPASASQ